MVGSWSIIAPSYGASLCRRNLGEVVDPVVLAKARAAATWCKHATEHEVGNHGKPWRYLLIPHEVIADNMTLDGLAKPFRFVAPDEGRSQMSMATSTAS